MEKSQTIKELATALCKAQGEMPSAGKDGVNPHFGSKFSTLANVMQTALPVLTKHGLSLSQLVTTLESGDPALTTILMHESGEYISSTMALKLVKQDPQGQGSGITYARRYAALAIIGMVADEDDDGNAASSGPAMATPAQLKLIGKIMTERNISADDIEDQYGKNPREMTVEEASNAIKELGMAKKPWEDDPKYQEKSYDSE